MLGPDIISAWDTAVYLGHILCMCRIFCAYLGVLFGRRVWRGFWLECTLIGQESGPLIGCLSPGLHFGGDFKSMQLCHSLSSFLPLFLLFPLSLYLVKCRWLCVWCECVWRAKAEPAEGCSVLLPVQRGSKWRWLPTISPSDRWSVIARFNKTESGWFNAAFAHTESCLWP